MNKHKDVKYIEQLFYQQIRALTVPSDSFATQHSDLWI